MAATTVDSDTELTNRPGGEGQWALGHREPLNASERAKKDDDPLHVRERIERIYSVGGFASIDPVDLRTRFRWHGLYTQRRPGIDGGRTAVLPPEEQTDYLDAIGLTEPGLNRVIRTGYELLDLVTYFTVGPKEARAWTITRGMRAPQAAGVIHSDFEKGFIRAETISYADYIAFNGEAGAKEAGRFRLEGKDYVVADGDVLHFRFAN